MKEKLIDWWQSRRVALFMKLGLSGFNFVRFFSDAKSKIRMIGFARSEADFNTAVRTFVEELDNTSSRCSREHTCGMPGSGPCNGYPRSLIEDV